MGIKRDPTTGIDHDLDLDFLGGPSDLPSVLRRSDFLVLALPLTPETRSIIGRNEFEQMKSGSYIVNVGRGAVIDHDALVDALASGHIAGAGLDVFWQEPVDPSDAIFDYNVIATPHVAGVTDTSYDEIAKGLADNVERIRSGLPRLSTASTSLTSPVKAPTPRLSTHFQSWCSGVGRAAAPPPSARSRSDPVPRNTAFSDSGSGMLSLSGISLFQLLNSCDQDGPETVRQWSAVQMLGSTSPAAWTRGSCSSRTGASPLLPLVPSDP